jgi:hypothetical protein
LGIYSQLLATADILNGTRTNNLDRVLTGDFS